MVPWDSASNTSLHCSKACCSLVHSSTNTCSVCVCVCVCVGGGGGGGGGGDGCQHDFCYLVVSLMQCNSHDYLLQMIK